MACGSSSKSANDNILAFHNAVNDGNLEGVMEMLARGADVDAEDTVLKLRPVHIAAAEGHLDILRLLISLGCSVNARASCVLVWSQEAEEGMTALHLAATKADSNLALALINAGADVNAKSSGRCGLSPLHIAALHGHVPVVQTLVSASANLNAENNLKQTPLSIAIRYNYEDVAKFLIQSGAAVNTGDSYGWTPLHLAIETGNINIAYQLIQNQAAVNGKNQKGLTPLLAATRSRRATISQLLIRSGADVNARDDKGHQHHAASSGYRYSAKTVKLLIEKGASVNARDDTAKTPLHLASEKDLSDVVQILIENEADVNDPAADCEWTPLHGAALNGSLASVKLLIANGAIVDPKTDRQSTPLHFAAFYWHAQVVKYLLAKGADCNAPDNIKRTPLYFAIEESFGPVVPHDSTLSSSRAYGSKLTTVKALVGSGADVNANASSDGVTPLHVAVRNNDPESVRCLLENGAHYDARCTFIGGNATVLDMAVIRSNETVNLLRCVERLFQAVTSAQCSETEKCLKEGAPVNSGSVRYGTPLLYASWKGNLAVAYVLVKNGASVNLSNGDGVTPLHYAAKFGHHEILCVLLQNGAVYNARTKTDKYTPLHIAHEAGHKVVADTLELIEHIFNRVSIKDNTVIQELKELKDRKRAEFAAMKNCKNVNGETLPHISSKIGFWELCKLFTDL